MLFLESMTRFLLRSRRLMAVSILIVLAGLVVLSAATRRPCLHACTGPWHVWKAGYMNEPEALELGRLRVTAEAHTPQTAPQESPTPAPTAYVPREEAIPPAIPLIAQTRHFRLHPP